MQKGWAKKSVHNLGLFVGAATVARMDEAFVAKGKVGYCCELRTALSTFLRFFLFCVLHDTGMKKPLSH